MIIIKTSIDASGPYKPPLILSLLGITIKLNKVFSIGIPLTYKPKKGPNKKFKYYVQLQLAKEIQLYLSLKHIINLLKMY